MKKLMVALALGATALLAVCGATYAASPWTGHCTAKYCPAIPLVNLVNKTEIRYCLTGVTHGSDIKAALRDPLGWKSPLRRLGIKLIADCQNSTVTFRLGATPPYQGVTNYGDGANWNWTKHYGALTPTCVITLDTAKWEKNIPEGRTWVVNHEFGHCLGMAHEDPGLMSVTSSSTSHVTTDLKHLLIARWK